MTGDDTQLVRSGVEGGIATITLDSVPNRNALSARLISQLLDALDAAIADVDVHAIVLTGAYFKVAEDGQFRGGALAAVNDVRGVQRGLTLGVFNYARELRGLQLGLINVSDNDGRRRVYPIIGVR